jgi:hypothetical protein
MGGLGIGTWPSGSTVGPAVSDRRSGGHGRVGSGRVGNFLKLGLTEIFKTRFGRKFLKLGQVG